MLSKNVSYETLKMYICDVEITCADKLLHE